MMEEMKKIMPDIKLPDKQQLAYKQPSYKAKIKLFLAKVALGQPKLKSFKDVFGVSWGNNKIYQHINYILQKESSRAVLKRYRDNLIQLLDQKKADLLLYLEQMVYNEEIDIQTRLRIIEQFSKLLDSYSKPTAQEIKINKDEVSVKQIFGL